MVMSVLALVTAGAMAWPTPGQLQSLGAGSSTQAAPPPAASTAPTAAPESEPAIEPVIESAVDPAAAKLLGELETADEQLRTFSAELIWRKVNGLAGDVTERQGRLAYLDSRRDVSANADAGVGGQRKFAVDITFERHGDRKNPDAKSYVFDGRWLVERVAGQKKMTKTEVVNARKPFDPLKLGEGPMPLPIGQSKADILTRFEATVVPTEEGLDEESPEFLRTLKLVSEQSVQLRLVPRAKFREDIAFSEIRLWYRRDAERWVPRIARTYSRLTGDMGPEDRDVDTLVLVGTTVNPALGENVFDTVAPSGWDVVVR
jgi:hypothetical protein